MQKKQTTSSSKEVQRFRGKRPRWKQHEQTLMNVNSARKPFSGQKHGRFHEVEEQVVVFVRTQIPVPVKYLFRVPLLTQSTRNREDATSKYRVPGI
jgi:hypothetical protein